MMESLFELLVSSSRWFFFTSLKASILIPIILLVQILLRQKISARWNYALWFILLIRLVLPFEIENKFNIFSLLPSSETTTSISSTFFENETPAIISMNRENQLSNLHVENEQLSHGRAASNNIPSDKISLLQITSLIWFSGVLIYSFLLVLNSFKLHLKIKTNSSPPNTAVLKIFQQCKKAMGVSSFIQLIEIESIKIPVLLGVLKPKIVLPKNLCATLNENEIKNILMHELAHFKRGDVIIAWITAFLQAVHWFNPVIWLAFFRMRSDRELACDEKTLDVLGANNSQAYGNTIITLLERISADIRLPMAVGIIESKTGLKRRLKMIINFRKKPLIWSFVAFALIAFLGVFSMTIAQKNVIQEITITAESGGIVRLNDEEIQINNLSKKLSEFRFNENSVISLLVNEAVTISDYIGIHRQLLDLPVNKIKYTNSKTGKSIITDQYNFFTSRNFHISGLRQLEPIKIEGKFGYKNKQGEIVIEPKYDEAWHFSEGLAPVRIGKHWGYINEKGDAVSEFIFDRIFPLEKGTAQFVLNGKSGFVDSTGTIIIQPKFDNAYPFYEGLAPVKMNDKWGFIDKKGSLVIDFQFNSAMIFQEGLAPVNKSGKWGYINKSGDPVINFRFDKADQFNDGRALVSVDRKYGYIDKTGSFVIKPQFEDAQDFSEGLAGVKINGKYGFTDKSGNIIIEPAYDLVINFIGGSAHVVIFEKPELQIKGQGFSIDKAGNRLADK